MVQVADASMTRLAEENTNRNFADDTLLVKFYIEPKQNKAKSSEEGRPIFDDTEYVSIAIPGNKTSVVIRPARSTDKERFPKHYAAFKERNQEEYISGTPLEAWTILSKSQVEELKFFNLRTIEQLAAMSDSNTQNMRGLGQLKVKAQMFLEAAEGGAPLERLEARLEELENKQAMNDELLEAKDARIAELETQLES